MLEQNIADEAAPHFAERREPGAGKVLFRQIALEVVRLHPRSYHQPSWSSRFKMAWWAVKMVWGRGKLPRVHRAVSPADVRRAGTAAGQA